MNHLCKVIGFLGLQCGPEYTDKPHDNVRENFFSHMFKYGLSYGTKEELEFRFQIYKENDEFINESNADPDHTFTVAHNKFSTMTKSELKRYRGLKRATRRDGETETDVVDVGDVPDSVDWRTKGALNPI